MPSSVIDQFSYDVKKAQLQITFVSGRVYLYHHVPMQIYTALKAAPSKGRYFNDSIRNAFKYQKLRIR